MSKENENKLLEARVTGRVQGVGFRYYTQHTARSLGLTGWVRNESDGSVVVVCEGDLPSLKRMAAWLEKGPPSAYVQHVEKKYKEYRGIYRTFTVE
ncbi:MAG TPA: acylphosphatase [Spirochaetia bacterium]|nr:acylphosphatase [Spirochaetia bacterium]